MTQNVITPATPRSRFAGEKAALAESESAGAPELLGDEPEPSWRDHQPC